MKAVGRAAWLSEVTNLKTVIDAGLREQIGRSELDAVHAIDWDCTPTVYQSIELAHGHVLQMREVWRADGYSLGDLLYSLPLAPGQQKLISVLDWERRKTARRDARRVESEEVVADLSRDRDVSDIVRSTLRETLDARSSADVSAVGGGLGGFIGPLVFGVAGGASSASSTASQTSGRQVSGSALNQVRDRTMRAASAVRGQRASVVQTARQGESVRASTEVVANYNHCHAMTVEYFEVLHHLQVSQELHEVQECLFVPLAITSFSQSKALRWREQLEPSVRRPVLRGTFAALERVATDWRDADVPTGRYADEPIVHIEGELWLRMRLPRPRDNASNLFEPGAWGGYAPWLGGFSPEEVWTRYLGSAPPFQRDAIWNRSIAPGIAQRLVNGLRFLIVPDGEFKHSLVADASLVSQFTQDRPLLVGVRVDANSIGGWTRAQIVRVMIEAPGEAPGEDDAPGEAGMTVDSATFRYRTAHLAHSLVANQRVNNDLAVGDPVEMLSPLDRLERRNPRELDQRLAEELIEHLDEHIEHYHRAIWLRMDPNRRYLLLDGFVAPDAGGRSVATVVENRVVGIVGNCLVLPLRPGAQLDPTYEFARADLDDLRHLYAGAEAPPMRISIPTRGVFADAVLGRCNSCEVIDDARFWRFEEEPLPDQPTAIAPLSTGSRRETPPALAADQFPEPLVRLQEAPTAPDPTGLAAAMKTLGTAGIFGNLTGLALNQADSVQALKTAITTAQGFATQAGALAQQRFMNRELDRSLARIKDARDKNLIDRQQAQRLAESAVRGAIGEPRPKQESATASKGVAEVIDRAGTAANGGSVRVTRPEGTVEVRTGDQASPEGAGLDVAVDPPVEPIKQKTDKVCWAAGGTMMLAWKRRVSMSVEAALDSLGGDSRAKYDADTALDGAQFRDFAGALGLTEEGPTSYTPAGLARLLGTHGPLLVVTDDSFGPGNLLVHVRIVTAVRGDGTPDGTTVVLADSTSGRLEPEPFTRFAGRLEAAEAVEFGAGIFHF